MGRGAVLQMKNESIKMDFLSHMFTQSELALYLDTHPNDKHALAKFNEIRGKSAAAQKEYEKEYGLLRFDNHTNAERWEWVDDPWPWEFIGSDAREDCV